MRHCIRRVNVFTMTFPNKTHHCSICQCFVYRILYFRVKSLLRIGPWDMTSSKLLPKCTQSFDRTWNMCLNCCCFGVGGFPSSTYAHLWCCCPGQTHARVCCYVSTLYLVPTMCTYSTLPCCGVDIVKYAEGASAEGLYWFGCRLTSGSLTAHRLDAVRAFIWHGFLWRFFL